MRRQPWVIVGSVFAGALVLALLLAVSFLWGRLTSQEASAPAPRPAATSTVAPASTQLKGEVVRKEPNFYVIRDANGREFRLRVSQRTSVEQEPKIGDQVIARVDPRPAEVYAKTLGVRSEGSPNDKASQKPAGLEVIEGVVLQTEGQSFVVRDISGREVRLHIDGHTKKDGNVTVGDHVIARTDAATEPGYTVSLMKH